MGKTIFFLLLNIFVHGKQGLDFWAAILDAILDLTLFCWWGSLGPVCIVFSTQNTTYIPILMLVSQFERFHGYFSPIVPTS